jgi:hypothetical protein
LRLVRSAVVGGWMADPQFAARRAGLIDALMALIADRSTRPREVLAIAKLMVAMNQTELGRGKSPCPPRLRK